MKGLLLKDFYLMGKYCRVFLLMIAVFISVSFIGKENMFYTFYPSVISGILPVTLLSYDEKEKWDVYAGTLPVTRAQIVSSKYLIGLSINILLFVLMAAGQAFRMINTQAFEAGEYFTRLMSIMSVSLIAPAILLPFVFKFGTEKGRIAYFAMIMLVCAGGVALGNIDSGLFSSPAVFIPSALVFAAVVLIYIASWLLSIYFYERREL